MYVLTFMNMFLHKRKKSLCEMFVHLSSIEHVVRMKICPSRMKAFRHIEGRLEWGKYEFNKVGMVTLIL